MIQGLSCAASSQDNKKPRSAHRGGVHFGGRKSTIDRLVGLSAIRVKGLLTFFLSCYTALSLHVSEAARRAAFTPAWGWTVQARLGAKVFLAGTAIATLKSDDLLQGSSTP